jgi:lysozyme
MTDRTREAYFAALREFAPDGHIGTDDFRMLDSIAMRWKIPEAAMPEMRPSPAAEALIKSFEGCEKKRADGMIEAYPDPGTGGEPWTIGWGSTGADIHKGTLWTQAEADRRFSEDLAKFALGVSRMVREFPTSQNEFDALVSFAYNAGSHALASSTLLKYHMAGDKARAADEFHRWTHSGGKVMNGLIRRRTAEANLYRGRMA